MASAGPGAMAHLDGCSLWPGGAAGTGCISWGFWLCGSVRPGQVGPHGGIVSGHRASSDPDEQLPQQGGEWGCVPSHSRAVFTNIIVVFLSFHLPQQLLPSMSLRVSSGVRFTRLYLLPGAPSLVIEAYGDSRRKHGA